MDSAAQDNEKILAETMSELEKAETSLAEHERALRAPKGTYVLATPDEITAAKKASQEGSPRWRRGQKKSGGGVRREDIRYRNYIISYYRKPARDFGDWNFQHIDYDGALDFNDQRCGYAETPKEARAEIDAQYVDLELDEDGYYTRRGKVLQAGTHE